MSQETIPNRLIGVIRDDELLVVARKKGILPYPPKVRTRIVAHLDELYGCGLTLPDGSGRPLRLRPTRKEQISVCINDGPGKIANPTTLTNPRIWRN